MKRHAKGLQKKAKTHDVRPTGRGTLEVRSGTSGALYTVFLRANGNHACVAHDPEKPCFNQYNRRTCSHIRAALAWCDTARVASYWNTEESARRQHRPVTEVEPGLWMTTRKVKVEG